MFRTMGIRLSKDVEFHLSQKEPRETNSGYLYSTGILYLQTI